MSSLEALNGFKIELDLVQKIIKDYTNLINAGKTIEFCWIPSHVNIPGNERADTAAKASGLSEWAQQSSLGTLLKRFGYQIKRAFSVPNSMQSLRLWISSVAAKTLNL